MTRAAPTNLRARIRIGPDQVTIRGEEIIIDARRGFADWQVRELNPVPIYFEDQKYLLVQSSHGNAPLSMRYVLTAWPEKLNSSSTRFYTYDEAAVLDRDTGSRAEQRNRAIFMLLLPLYPFLGLLWSAAQERLAYIGFVPRYLTRMSIAALFVFVPGLILFVLLGWVPPLLLLLAFPGFADLIMRSHHCARDETWCGGFLEWAIPRVHEFPFAHEPRTPGFLASIEILLWSMVETAAGSRSNRNVQNQSAHLPPVIERELRQALRKQKPVRRRLRLATAGTAIVLLLSLIAGANAGRDLHHLLCLAGFYVVVSAPQRIAGLFSSERQEQTLGLLLISGLSATEVFLSKTVSAMAIVFSDLIALTPVMALPFLMGGVSFDLFLETVCCLPNVLLFVVAISLLGSVLCDDEGTAVFVTFALGIITAGLPAGLYLAQKLLSNHTWNWLVLSNPAYGPWLVFQRFSAAQTPAFWTNFVFTFCESILCLSIASLVLGRYWRQREEHGFLFRCGEKWRIIIHGAAQWRKRLANEYMDSNPCAWLAGRDRGPLTLAWIGVGGVAVIWTICWALWPSRWPGVINFLITAALLNLGLRWIIHYTAAAGIGLPRRDGSYELLLTTPLPPREIVRAHLAALRWRFQKISLVVLAIEVMMMVAGLFLRKWNPGSLAVYFILWAGLLAWQWHQSWNFGRTLLSMWAGLNTAQPLRAIWRLTGFGSWIWVWIIFSFRRGFGVSVFPSGSIPELLFVFTVVFIIFVILFGSRHESEVLQRRLASEFREIVREPLPDSRDPRFKQWNTRERFPWGWDIAKDQLQERLFRREEP